MLKLLVLTASLMTAAEGTTHDPHAPTPPTAPAAPKVEGPTAPTAPHKTEAAEPKAEAKGDAKKSEKPGEKGEAAKAGDKGEAKVAEKTDKAAKPDAKPAEKPAVDKAAADKAAKGRKTAIARDRGNGGGSAALPPPSLSGIALRNEIKQNGGEDKSAPAAPLTERQRLEQLASEITKAREALKQDTARLEAMLKGGGGDGRMPMGDGMAATGVDAGGAASREAMKEQILTVSKAMKGMKPEQAAAIIARLDRVLASEILRRMKASDAGAVMASLKPELAADLATTIATRRSMVDGDPKKDGKK